MILSFCFDVFHRWGMADMGKGEFYIRHAGLHAFQSDLYGAGVRVKNREGNTHHPRHEQMGITKLFQKVEKNG